MTELKPNGDVRTGGIKAAAIMGPAILAPAILAMAGLIGVFLNLVSPWQLGLASTQLQAGMMLIVMAAFVTMIWLGRRGIASLQKDKAAAEQARHEAESRVREKTRLLATMSHEIRTPLNGVIGMVNLLLETGLTAEQRNYADTANASSRMLLSIVDEVLDRAKNEAAGSGRSIAFDPRLILENASELLAARAIGKAIDVSAYVAPEVPPVLETGELALRQIVFNLAGNAVKFTETGSVSIELSAPRSGWLALKVADTGVGMTAAQLGRVFNDYEQATAETFRQFGGTGLGLGIARTLAEQQGGHIEVASTPGLGTVFTVHLPHAGKDHAGTPPARPLAGRSFRLAMAETAARLHLQQSLIDLGAAVALADDAAALSAALKAPDETVIADASLLAAQRHKGRFAAKSHVWVILKPEERRFYRDLIHSGYAGYLLKPLRRTSLLARLSGGDVSRLAQTAHALRRAVRRTDTASGLHILVADDNPVNLLLAKTLLAKAGHKVTAATSGSEVLALLAAGQTVDMLLLDVEMPGLSGHETAQAIRAGETGSGRRLPILGLTAHARPEELQACLDSGMDDYLSKPFDSEDLAEMIRKLRHSAAA